MSLRDRIVRWTAPVVLLVAIFGTGCILWPVGGYKPYKGGEIGFIRVGVTTKDEIIDRLGQPRSALLLETGSVLVYRSSGVSKWFFGWVGPHVGGAGTSHVPYSFVLSVYLSDEDTVTRTRVTRVRSNKFFKSKGCPKVNLCYDRGQWMFLVSRDMQQRILSSAVPNDRCAVLVYADVRLLVTIDDNPESIVLNEETFVRRLVGPGVHRARRDLTEFEFECEAGRTHVLRVASDGLQSVDADVGLDEIHTRRLLLTPRGS